MIPQRDTENRKGKEYKLQGRTNNTQLHYHILLAALSQQYFIFHEYVHCKLLFRCILNTNAVVILLLHISFLYTSVKV